MYLFIDCIWKCVVIVQEVTDENRQIPGQENIPIKLMAKFDLKLPIKKDILLY